MYRPIALIGFLPFRVKTFSGKIDGENEAVDISIARALADQLAGRLRTLGFHTEGAERSKWAARKTVERRWLGWRTVVYCLTYSLDAPSNVVRLSDAVLQKKQGLLTPGTSPAEAAGCSEVRSQLKQLVQEAGWQLYWGTTRGGMRPPRVFTL